MNLNLTMGYNKSIEDFSKEEGVDFTVANLAITSFFNYVRESMKARIPVRIRLQYFGMFTIFPHMVKKRIRSVERLKNEEELSRLNKILDNVKSYKESTKRSNKS